MPNVRVVSRNFMEMVAALPAAKLDDLYGNPWTCQAVLRQGNMFHKKRWEDFAQIGIAAFAIREHPAAYIQEKLAMNADANKNWALHDAVNKHKGAVDKLEQLRVLIDASDREKGVTYKLNPKFQKQLQEVIRTGGGVTREPLPAKFAAKVPSLSDLDNYSTKQWEAVLLQLVTSAFTDSPADTVNNTLVQTLQRAGLLTATREQDSTRITDAGFQFLLMDTNSQLWQIVREYVASAEERAMDSAELISFLLELGFLHVGEPYNLNILSPMQQNVIKELAALGVLQIQAGTKDRWFVPTRLATNFSASISEASSVPTGEGFLIVETNFRVYAYTASKLKAEILRLFVRLEYQLPNLVVGSLTKDSVSTAFASGISSEQIINFFSKHAHPHAMQKVPVVPETVTDQIRLWENDRNRLQICPAFIYKDFPTMEIYQAVAKYAADIGALLWDDPDGKRFVGKGGKA